MCIVLDASVFTSIINSKSTKNIEFKPVFDWIAYGRGKAVYGGSKYSNELKNNHRFRSFLQELERRGKTVLIDCDAVDGACDSLVRTVYGKNFNDHHIMAIILVSGCRLICSEDKGLHALVAALYSRKYRGMVKAIGGRVSRPRIYQNRKHISLLCDGNIANCCK
jgi:hypothetical protein